MYVLALSKQTRFTKLLFVSVQTKDSRSTGPRFFTSTVSDQANEFSSATITADTVIALIEAPVWLSSPTLQRFP
jgi:hypothetical protein